MALIRAGMGFLWTIVLFVSFCLFELSLLHLLKYRFEN